MNTQQLESFIQVAENLNFARAAESLNVTTSAVSRQIRSLEEELNTKLLHRTTKNVSLTPSGIIFYNDAKEILARLQLATKKIQHHSGDNVQPISIGYTNELETSMLVHLLQQCRKELPMVRPLLHIVPSRLLLNMFIHDEIDILFCFQNDIPLRENFVYCELAQIPICCVLPKDHPLSHREELSKEELHSENIVICNSHEIPPQVSNIQNMISRQFPLNRTYYSENLQAMMTLIKAGYGIGIFPEMPSVDTSLTYVPLDLDYSLSYGVFYKNNSKNPVLKNFLSLLHVK